MNGHLEQEKALAGIRKDIGLALERLGLNRFVSINEIGQEIGQSETAFQSLLLLGILRRVMVREDDETAKLFIPAVTEWKNYLPHKDLDGLSPFEYREKYPPGPYEMKFIAGLMDEYQARLESLNKKEEESFDLQKDFSSFQKDYLERLPVEQPVEFGKFKSLKEIIIEERRRSEYPEKDLDKIGAHVFAENTAEGTGWKMAEIEDNYSMIVNELADLQAKPSQRSRKRVKEICSFFDRVEPYFRCGLEPHRFYLNYASVLLLEDESKRCLEMLDKALDYEPNYELARKMKDRVSS